MAKKIGYIKIVKETDIDLTDTSMKHFVESCDLLFKEDISHNKSNHIERNDMISRLIQGDIVVIKNLVSSTTGLKDLLEFVHMVHKKGASIISLEDTWVNSTPENKSKDYFNTMFEQLYMYETNVHLLRVQSGIDNAKNKGIKFGRPPKDEAKIKEALELYQTGQYTGAEICNRTGISRRTLYNYINKFGLR